MTAPTPQDVAPADRSSRLALFTGGLAAILASACCLGPLALLALGISGAWIGSLTRLEPYRPLFVAAAVVSLYLARRRIYRPVDACRPGEICAVPAVNRTYRTLFWIVVGFLAIALAYPFVAPFLY